MAIYEDHTDYTIRAWLQEPVHLPDVGRPVVARQIRQTPQQRHWWPDCSAWKSQSMFTATKFVAAAVTLAVSGGLVLSGSLTSPSDRSGAPGAVATSVPSPSTEPSLPSGIADQLHGLEANLPDEWTLPLVVTNALAEGDIQAVQVSVGIASEVLADIREGSRLLPEAPLLAVIRPRYEAAQTTRELEEVTDLMADIVQGARQVVGPLGELQDALPDGWMMPVVVTAALADERFDDVPMAASAAAEAVTAVAAADSSLPDEGILDSYRDRFEAAGSVEDLQALGAEVTATTSDAATEAPDLLSGVDLVTEEVEPGVYRVVSDGVRDLSVPFEDSNARYIAAGPDGSIWVFQDRTFFRLGELDTRTGPWIYGVDVDTDGNVWALGKRNAKNSFGCSDAVGSPHLLMFDGSKWTAKFCGATDFQLRSDDSLFIATVEHPNRTREPKRNRMERQKVTDLGDGYRLFAASPPSPGVDEGWDSAWVVDDRDRLGLARFSLRTCPPYCLTSDWGDAGPEGKAVGVGFGGDRSSWAFFEFSDPVMVDGVLTTEPADFLVQFAPMPVDPGSNLGISATGPPEQIGAYPSDLGTARLTRNRRLDVAPDGAVWLPTDDGLARFDGDEWEWHLRGQTIEDLDITEDGTVWVIANDVVFDADARQQEGTAATYVIAP